MKNIGQKFVSVITPICVLLIWELLARFNFINPIYFPPPSSIFIKLVSLLVYNKDNFTRDIYCSLYRLSLGTFIAVPPAIFLGIFSETTAWIGFIVKPIISLTYPLPRLAIFPLFLIIFGIGDSSKVALISLGIFYLVLINTALGQIRLKNSGYMDIAVAYNLSFYKKVFKIYFRGTLPEILTGIKAGIGYGLVMVIASEFTISQNGIGFFLWQAWDQFKVVEVYCCLFILAFIGWLLFVTIDYIIKKISLHENS